MCQIFKDFNSLYLLIFLFFHSRDDRPFSMVGVPLRYFNGHSKHVSRNKHQDKLQEQYDNLKHILLKFKLIAVGKICMHNNFR